MIRTQMDDAIWALYWGDLLLAQHCEAQPFATAIRRRKTYTADRGTVKTQTVETERIPLLDLTDADESGFTLWGEGRCLRVEVCPTEQGAELKLTGEPGWAYEFSLPSEPGEAVFGGGEQYRKTDLRGETVVNFVSEHIKASTVLQKAFLPRALYREKAHHEIGSYAPMPLFVTDRRRLILFDADRDGTSVFTDGDWRFDFDACPKSLTLLAGESYKQLARLLADRIPNRMYLPDWCMEGMILGVQGGIEAVKRKVDTMLEAGAKVSGVWCQDWCGENRTVMGKQVWWNWEVDELLYPNLKEEIRALNQKGVCFLAYINPYLVKDGRLYNECAEKGWLIMKRDGSIYHIKSTTFDAGMLDLTNPNAVRFVKDVLIRKNMLELGISGWMADFGEYLPVDCVLHDGDPAELHNRWPVLWAKLNREAIEEAGAKDAFFFSRSGYLGIQSYAPILWNGDQHTDLSKDYGMPCVMPASFSLGFSGVPLVHSDIGGFFSFGRLRRDDELFIRWMEMAAFSPLMRSHESLRPWDNSQFDAKKVLPYTVKLTKLHTVLKPYLAHCLNEAKEGLPVLRPDFWFDEGPGAGGDMYSYFLGSELYVCPVIERKAQYRQVTLPSGDWVHLWTGTEVSGGQTAKVRCRLGRPPVFYRKDSPFTELFRTLKEI